MEYVIIYEFAPSSFQVYHLLVAVIIIVLGIIGYRSIRKSGFINIFLVRMPFSQDSMNKIMEFFMLIIIVFGSIGLMNTLVNMPRQLRIVSELENSNKSKNIDVIEISIPSNISIYDNIRLKENLILDEQEFVFAKTENRKEYNCPQKWKLVETIENRLFRISFVSINDQNIILKIEASTQKK